ncbi:C-C motif chemokine 13-like [Talpa occidentalis]|uniref:C-C motif chemokine 13-like n=1 Tax=Talpa occidentalis TaxID=50954 RepID=UPI00188F2F75|nr:C-C motif chemokine 13-like [Talpa occidentalis]
MKASAALLCLLLTAATLTTQVPAQTDQMSRNTCCYSFNTRKIPKKMLDNYRITSGQCPMGAVVFKTKRGKEICANPRHYWVMDSIKHLNKKTQTLKP